jgi:hypothetical protein
MVVSKLWLNTSSVRLACLPRREPAGRGAVGAHADAFFGGQAAAEQVYAAPQHGQFGWLLKAHFEISPYTFAVANATQRQAHDAQQPGQGRHLIDGAIA